MDTNQYLDLFLDESREHLQNMDQGLLELEQSHGNLDVVNEIFRSAHTLKGMAGSMGFQNMTELTHQLENILDAIRNQTIQVNTEIIDALFEAADHLEQMVDLITNGEGDAIAIDALMDKLKTAAGLKTKTTNETAATTDTTAPEDQDFVSTIIDQAREQGFNVWKVEVKVSKDCMLKAARAYMVFEIIEQMGDVIQSEPVIEKIQDGDYDESFTVSLITHDTQEEAREKILKVSEIDNVLVEEIQIETSTTQTKPVAQNTSQSTSSNQASNAKGKTKPSHKTIRVSSDRLDELMNLFEELVIDKGRLEEITRQLQNSELGEVVETISQTSGRLQEIILNLRMEPVEQVFNRFPKMVRSVSKELGKKISLEMFGADTELDRNVIDEIGDPLVYLLRNSMDHGIETPDVRINNQKPEEGKIKLSAYHSGNHVYIEIQDDGAGINRSKILNKAIEKGLVTEEAGSRLADNEIYELMFQSGFSTADKISDISGRGVGLDVVKNKIESLGGSVSVESEEGKGSRFIIQLPLTLSIISSMLVQVQNEIYALPLSSIVETALIEEKDLFKAHGQEMIEYRDRVIPYNRLNKMLDVPGDFIQHEKFRPAIIAQSGKNIAAFAIDKFIGQQEIVIKSLGSYLGDVSPISGATILGNGQVALILDCSAMINKKESE